MYNPHRGMVPAGAQNNRLNDLLDQVRHEFDSSAGRAVEFEGQRTYNPSKWGKDIIAEVVEGKRDANALRGQFSSRSRRWRWSGTRSISSSGLRLTSRTSEHASERQDWHGSTAAKHIPGMRRSSRG